MILGKKVLAIIPARGGSKRLPGKNSKLLLGKPVIAYSIEAARNSRYVDEVLVSTDDQALIDISKKYSAWVPFVRPKELATDEATTTAVLEHAIQYCGTTERGRDFGYILLLQPTSPLRTTADVDSACELLIQSGNKAVVSVCEAEHSPLWTNTLPDNLSMGNFIRDEVKGIRSQDLPKFYRLNGAIYLCETEVFLKEKTFLLEDRVIAYIMDQQTSVDIDSMLDFRFCEFLLSNQPNL